MKKFFTFVAAAFAAMTINAQAITVAEAIEEGMKLDSMATSEAEYTVEGYVINAGSFSMTYHNQSWYMADAADAKESDLQAYNCYPIDGTDTLKVLNGDKVSVTGKLKKYYNKTTAKYIIEFEKANATFLSKTEGDHAVSTETETITIAKALEIGNALEDGKSTEKQYVLTGYVSAEDVAFSDSYGNQSFWVADAERSTAASNADGAFYVYRGKPSTGAAIPVGAKVTFTTTIKKYVGSNGTVIENTDQNIVITVEGGTNPVDDADVIFGKDDFKDQGTTNTGSLVTATKNGVTFTCDKAYGDGQYGVRCYKGSTVTITAADTTIAKIVFEFGTASGKTYDGNLETEYVVNGNEWTSGELASQARMNKIQVYFGTAEAPVVTVITVAEALEIGETLELKAETPDKYTIEGFVTQIDDNSFNTDYKNMTFWIADQPGTAATNADGAFEVFRGKPDVELVLGDYVRVVTTIKKYQTGETYVIETGSISSLVKVSHEGIENVVLTEKAQKVIVDGVLYIIRDNKLYNIQGLQVR